MPILRGPDAPQRAYDLTRAHHHATEARRHFLNAKVRDGEVYAALQQSCHALARLIEETEIVK